ncbi:TetR/AcrR family transcriptional regulator [Aliifodinibius sp. S!AR15-10]|uniref:TetR/AcrR family transcriptional regulator n=1 Tax=Aliifodinibius sp. S!AR15-10 TaxID=2950437 RepID=UPI00285EF3B4|nr:TetR/AcrR family transcriptional regulator [Aliifodinibius sp. S!AR15-10]MDR8390046.1 TetR/AcrR family transcriptional regulator [Aliifodinibius sp. S!AR15-10]
MGTEERRKREKKQRKKTIICAAEELILEHGLDAITMNDIAERSELSKGTLYLYYPSKDDLVYAINSKGFSIINEELSKIFSSNESGKKMIERLWKLGVRFPENYPIHMEAFRHYELHTKARDIHTKPIVKECEEKRQLLLTHTYRILQVAMQDGSVKGSYSPRLLTLMLWSGIRGMLEIFDAESAARNTPFFQDFNEQEHEIYNTFMDIVMHGIIQK